ncbi:hypothetical protein [Plasticicumulans sp.]|uniref:hypothetical protein n=1 Tax=Plasticicumulans sp. TaxID=2307179 RepID=UPI002BABED16|nr:hypothetical protein [Plasticicumulans sp.]HMX54279.1 hypothetical protein [Plasticicumulans sp.]HNK32600.1 hypothetical protein [Plasticicumulans sp.]HNM44403.1 hypothetical protein [Plasticicumulans sp.]
MRPSFPVLTMFAALAAAGPVAAGVLADFEGLATPPPVDGATGFEFANGGSLDYAGVRWDDRIQVVGDAYRVDTATPGPLFGLPHSGSFFINNHNGADGILLETTQVLTGAWFARNEYYGFGGGADQVSITALGAGGDLLTLSLDLPELLAGLPEQPGFFDTSAFLALSGITGYRIDRRETGPFSADWVADDFTFEAAVTAIPAPSVLALFGLGGLGLCRCRR